MGVFVKVCLLCAFLACFLLYPANAQKKHRLSVGDVAGYYVTNDRNVTYKTMTISFTGKTSKAGDFEQANFTGIYGDSAIVGQGIISGDEGMLANFITFDFMYLEPQDETLLLHSTTIMEKGKVIGLLINEAGLSPDARKQLPARYRSVTYEAFVRFQRTLLR